MTAEKLSSGSPDVILVLQPHNYRNLTESLDQIGNALVQMTGPVSVVAELINLTSLQAAAYSQEVQRRKSGKPRLDVEDHRDLQGRLAFLAGYNSQIISGAMLPEINLAQYFRSGRVPSKLGNIYETEVGNFNNIFDKGLHFVDQPIANLSGWIDKFAPARVKAQESLIYSAVIAGFLSLVAERVGIDLEFIPERNTQPRVDNEVAYKVEKLGNMAMFLNRASTEHFFTGDTDLALNSYLSYVETYAFGMWNRDRDLANLAQGEVSKGRTVLAIAGSYHYNLVDELPEETKYKVLNLFGDFMSPTVVISHMLRQNIAIPEGYKQVALIIELAVGFGISSMPLSTWENSLAMLIADPELAKSILDQTRGRGQSGIEEFMRLVTNPAR